MEFKYLDNNQFDPNKTYVFKHPLGWTFECKVAQETNNGSFYTTAKDQQVFKATSLPVKELNNWGSCMDCNWHGDLKDCETEHEPDEFKGTDYTYPVCPKCGGAIE